MAEPAKLKIINDTPAIGRGTFRTSPAADTLGWRHAIKDFLIEKKGHCEERTVAFYRDRLLVASDWLIRDAREGKGVAVEDFRMRDFREFLAARADARNPRTGKLIKDNTRRSDAICLRALIAWCAKEGLIDRNHTAEYKLPRRDTPHVPIPDEQDITKLLGASMDRWLPSKNPSCKYFTPKARQFFSRRQFALLCVLIDSGMRIGEALDLKLSDYDRERKQASVAEAKSNRPRVLPISDSLCDAIDAYLRARPKCDEDRLFISEYGNRIDYWVVRKCLRRDCAFAGVPEISFHQLRHYAATAMAKVDIWAAQMMLGHSSPTVTKAYLHASADHIRDAHTAAGPLTNIIVSKRSERAKRKKLI